MAVVWVWKPIEGEGIYRNKLDVMPIQMRSGRDGVGGEKTMKARDDNNRRKGCTIKTVRLQLGRFGRGCPYV